jgi:hypothetical protein
MHTSLHAFRVQTRQSHDQGRSPVQHSTSQASSFVPQNADSLSGADLYTGLNAGHEILSIEHEWIPKKDNEPGPPWPRYPDQSPPGPKSIEMCNAHHQRQSRFNAKPDLKRWLRSGSGIRRNPIPTQIEVTGVEINIQSEMNGMG